MDKGKAVLHIETDMERGHSEVEISGTPTKILLNLIAVTNRICEELSIPPEALAYMLPRMIRDYKQNILKGKVGVGFNPFRNGG